MDRPDSFVTAILEEDRRLRALLDRCPDELRERSGSRGVLGCKETLGHLAFWDGFAVRFFLWKLGRSDEEFDVPFNFEERSQAEVERTRQLPFAEVIHSYTQSTHRVIAFLQEHWLDLSSQERADWTISLRHRRHHRLLLQRSLAPVLEKSEPGKSGRAGPDDGPGPPALEEEA
jgi:hypothetical protein